MRLDTFFCDYYKQFIDNRKCWWCSRKPACPGPKSFAEWVDGLALRLENRICYDQHITTA